MNPPTPRRATSGIVLAAALIAAGLTVASPASADPVTISVEAESAISTNLALSAGANSSGGQHLGVLTDAEPGTGDYYYATFDVSVAEGGIYDLVAIGSPANETWASASSVRIGTGAWLSTAGAEKLSEITSTLWEQRLLSLSLDAGVNSVTVRVDARRTTPDSRYYFTLDKFDLVPATLSLTTLTSSDAYNVFQSGEPVEFAVGTNAIAPGTEVDYTVTDYWGQVVASGTVDAGADGSIDVIDVSTLTTGQYRIRASSATAEGKSETTFAIVPSTASRANVEDSPFAADSAGAGFPSNASAQAREEYAELIEELGVAWIRDRTTWNSAVDPGTGTYDFAKDPANAFTTAMQSTGVKISEVFHTAPAWAVADDGGKLPNDLFDVYGYLKAAGEHYDGNVSAWEIWNEADGGFASAFESPTEYAAFLKAAAIGLADSGSDALLSTQGSTNSVGYYERVLAVNEVLERYADVWNYHVHTPVSGAPITAFPGYVDAQVDIAEQYGDADTRTWLTEAGIGINVAAGTFASDAQQRAQARYLVTSAVTSISQGTQKHFWFIAQAYSEGANYWGMLSRQKTPYAGFTAASVLTATAGEGVYLGTNGHLPAGVIGHVFDTGAGEAAVLWANELTTIDLAVDAPTATLVDVMGRSTPLVLSDGRAQVEVGPDPVYVVVAGSAAAFDTVPGAARPVSAAASVTSELDDVDRIVLQPEFTASATAGSRNEGYGLDATAANAVALRIYNFNEEAVEVAVSASVDAGWTATGGDTVTVSGMSSSTVPFSVAADSGLDYGAEQQLVFHAEADGQPVSLSAASIRAIDPALTISTRVIDGGHAVQVSYTNMSDDAQGLLTVSADTAAGSASVPVQGQLEPGGSFVETIGLPTGSSAEVDSYTVTVSAASETVAMASSALDAEPIGDYQAVGGEGDAAVMDLVDDATVDILEYGGAEDLSGTISLMRTADGLVLSGVIHDDVHDQPATGSSIWTADAIQLSTSVGGPAENGVTNEVGLALTSAGAYAHLFKSGDGAHSTGALQLEGLSISRDEQSHTTTYHAQIPWALLGGLTGQAGEVFSVSILVTDADGVGRTGFAQWGSGIATDKSPADYVIAYFR